MENLNLAQIQELIESSNIEELINIGEELELELAFNQVNDITNEHVYTWLLLCYLTKFELENIKYLAKRISPDQIKEKNISQLYQLSKLLWQKEYFNIPPFLASMDLDKPYDSLLNLFKDNYNKYIINLIQLNYSELPFDKVSKFLGLDLSTTKQKLEELEWEIDATGEFVKPKPIDSHLNNEIGIKEFESIAQLAISLQYN
ncbi:hypothetical protein CONCODRAFT_78481 [Conidiobolus coronatus NRRL 28638]|uniref:CSN8/PSMD8/EIF3K domain-containing protein n=1 Tax=Conidiobolus coronatus (strain ATCC 28846 / CBS 209.66 / NRRL 28638) TaxID=796925 RepID=A0A137P856_CONC2|nr:hypothetical protein CONCODRAFT_78481 [Conidiobolus coronatus NRRL 28638]|eukprot:KXN71186.1 hypothetical protein CONCODRAFT_78481 [Conidiobolus coronatus NRRL 28638]